MASSEPIKPIPTHYAGCHFRSRLEARWAEFFDALNIEWEYEPNGYTVGPPGERCNYLPDFYLPRAVPGGTWVEVKGVLSTADQRKLFHAAHPIHGLPETHPRFRLVLLGDVPYVKPGWMCWQHTIGWINDNDWVDGLITSSCVFKDDGTLELFEDGGVPIDMEQPDASNPSFWNFRSFVNAESWWPQQWTANDHLAKAYAAARSARFGT